MVSAAIVVFNHCAPSPQFPYTVWLDRIWSIDRPMSARSRPSLLRFSHWKTKYLLTMVAAAKRMGTPEAKLPVMKR
jgi:hypothetical protein